jgi:hypothetical protein
VHDFSETRRLHLHVDAVNLSTKTQPLHHHLMHLMAYIVCHPVALLHFLGQVPDLLLEGECWSEIMGELPLERFDGFIQSFVDLDSAGVNSSNLGESRLSVPLNPFDLLF